MGPRRWLPRITIVVLMAGLWPDVERLRHRSAEKVRASIGKIMK